MRKLGRDSSKLSDSDRWKKRKRLITAAHQIR